MEEIIKTGVVGGPQGERFPLVSLNEGLSEFLLDIDGYLRYRSSEPNHYRGLRFYRALRNNGYSVTSGNVGYIGISYGGREGHNIGYMLGVYKSSGDNVMECIGYVHDVNVTHDRFEPFEPTVQEINSYIRYIESSISGSDRWRDDSMDLATMSLFNLLAYKFWKYGIEPDEAEVELFLEMANHSEVSYGNGDMTAKDLEVMLEAYTDVFYGVKYPEEEDDADNKNEELAKVPSMNIDSIIDGMSDNQKEEMYKEMIGRVDLKRFQVLMSVLVSGRLEESIFFKKKDIISHFLRDWAVAKLPYYILFGNQLSIKGSVETEIGGSEFMELVRETCDEVPELVPVFSMLSDMVPPAKLAKNDMNGATLRFSNVMQSGKSAEVARQQKVTQVISKLFNNQHIDSKVSLLYEQTSVKAIIEVSIDPYDYMTQAVNQHGWRSCHRLNGGEYAGAGLSYMTDKTTLMGFAHNGREYQYDVSGFKWKGNSKRWRQCIHISRENCATVFSREFPSVNESLAVGVRLLLEGVVARFFNVKNTWKVSKNHTSFVKFQRISEHVYDDINGHPDSTKYVAVQSEVYQEMKQKKERQDILSGANIICPYCGTNKSRPAFNSSCGAPVCDSCSDKLRSEARRRMREREEERIREHDRERENVAPNTSATLSWTAPAGGTNNAITGYQVQRSTSSSSGLTAREHQAQLDLREQMTYLEVGAPTAQTAPAISLSYGLLGGNRDNNGDDEDTEGDNNGDDEDTEGDNNGDDEDTEGDNNGDDEDTEGDIRGGRNHLLNTGERLPPSIPSIWEMSPADMPFMEGISALVVRNGLNAHMSELVVELSRIAGEMSDRRAREMELVVAVGVNPATVMNLDPIRLIDVLRVYGIENSHGYIGTSQDDMAMGVVLRDGTALSLPRQMSRDDITRCIQMRSYIENYILRGSTQTNER